MRNEKRKRNEMNYRTIITEIVSEIIPSITKKSANGRSLKIKTQKDIEMIESLFFVCWMSCERTDDLTNIYDIADGLGAMGMFCNVEKIWEAYNKAVPQIKEHKNQAEEQATPKRKAGRPKQIKNFMVSAQDGRWIVTHEITNRNVIWRGKLAIFSNSNDAYKLRVQLEKLANNGLLILASDSANGMVVAQGVVSAE